MLEVPNISEPLAAELALRTRRSRAVKAVAARLEAARAEAEGESSAAATVVAAFGDRVTQLCELRDRLEAEHAEGLRPTPEIASAESALASATERVHTVPVDDDAAATTAANALADAEDRLSSAQQAQARKARPLALRLSIAIEQTGNAERESKAAQDALDAAAKRVRGVLVDELRLRRDAALLAYDEATLDLAIAGGEQYGRPNQTTLGESQALMTELGLQVDFYFGHSSWQRFQTIGHQVDSARLLHRADQGGHHAV